MGERLHHISAHDALILLRNSFAIPKLLYTLRTAPCFHSPALGSYDQELQSIVSNITNIHFSPDDPAWSQATLPIRLGGLGIRRAVQLAPSAFLASAAATRDLVQDILPGHLSSLPTPDVDQALLCWREGHPTNPPVNDAAKIQRSWDFPRVAVCADVLLDNAPDDSARARLLAVSAPESGAWLHALPISALGLRLDDDAIRVAVGLRLGSPLCRPHLCQHCGTEVDQLGHHGLSCRKSEGRHYRHAAINDIVHRALSSAQVPSRLEPSGLSRSDGKRPDGVTMVPWENGKPLVWDATCPDTLAISYRPQATSNTGAVASLAEQRKSSKYCGLTPTHHFTPVAIESLGAIGPLTMTFLKDLGRRIQLRTGEEKAPLYLLQQVSIAVQRGNCVSVRGSIGGLAGQGLV